MAQQAISVKGTSKLSAKLLKAANLKHTKAGLAAAAIHIKSVMQVYPPATSANSSARKRWYQRGYGPKWRRKDGSVGGKRTSERLSTRWTHRLEIQRWQARVKNNASYAGPVQGSIKQQAKHMKKLGWKGSTTVLKAENKTVVDFINKGVGRDIK